MKYIILCRDYLTRFVVAKATKNMTAQTVIDFFLKDVCAKYGFPRIVLTDNGTQFTSAEFATQVGSVVEEHRFTVPYCQWVNGMAERAIGTLKQTISGHINKKHNNWDDLLDYAVFSINCTPHAVTGFSPFMLLLGYEPRMPVDNILRRPDMIEPEHFEMEVPEMAELLNSLRQKALDRLIEEANSLEEKSTRDASSAASKSATTFFKRFPFC